MDLVKRIFLSELPCWCMIKNLSAMQETGGSGFGVWSLGWEEPLEKGMARIWQHSSSFDIFDEGIFAKWNQMCREEQIYPLAFYFWCPWSGSGSGVTFWVWIFLLILQLSFYLTWIRSIRSREEFPHLIWKCKWLACCSCEKYQKLHVYYLTL